jgi:hypothetical protein
METTFEVTIFNPSGAPDYKAVSLDWAQFLQGHYTREKPTVKGRYIAVSDEGMPVGEVFCYKDKVGDLQVCFRVSVSDDIVDGYEGWIWSEPIPDRLPEMVPIYDTFVDKCNEVHKWKLDKEAAERRSKLSVVSEVE